MKKTLTLLLCVLILLQVPAFAEIEKSISNDHISIISKYRLKIDKTNRHMWLSYYRSESSASENYLKDRKPIHQEYLTFDLSKKESASDDNSEITFSSKKPPSLVLFENGNNLGQIFNITEIGTSYLGFSIANKEALASADKATLVVPRIDGTSLEIVIPDDVLKDWIFIATCNLKEEYEKGV